MARERPRPRAPRVVFTDPQIAAVGLAGASSHGRDAPGIARFVADGSRERLIGATFVGPEVADFLQAGTIAVVGEVPPPTLARALTPKQSRLPRWTVSRTKPIAVSDWRVVLADAGGLTALRLAANRRSGETPPCGSPSECVRPRLRRRDARRLVRWTCVAPSVSACCQSQSKLRRMRSNVRPHRPRSSRWPNSIRGRIRGRASEGACP